MLWVAIWLSVGSLVWFAAELAGNKLFGWSDRGVSTVLRAAVAMSLTVFVVAVPMFGIEAAEHARSFNAPEHQEWYYFAVNAIYPSLHIAPFAAMCGAIWGTVFWLRAPKPQTAGIAA
ncbi:hypothetical protein [Maricaulis sp.]|uniref:hypothetical protein n=1 Tax=Maricaulis sp. TaxID=1486257 RepID=UPI003A926DE3